MTELVATVSDAGRSEILFSSGNDFDFIAMIASYGNDCQAISDLGSYGQYRGNGVSLINLIRGKLPSMGIKANGNGTTRHRNIANLRINLLLR